jgi:hypothetical protein
MNSGAEIRMGSAKGGEKSRKARCAV